MYTTPPIPPDLKEFFNDHATHARSLSSLDTGTSSIFDISTSRSLALADIDLSAFAHSNYTMGPASTPPTAVYLPLIGYPDNYTSYLDKFWPADLASVLPHQSTSVHAILVPILSMLSVPVLITPFIFHIRHSNTGAWGILLCLILANFFSGLNALLWPSANFSGWYNGVGLCDLQSRISWPLTCAVASCTLCIVRGLANVLDIDKCDVNPPSRNKRNQKLAVELMICWFVPLAIAALSYLVQDQRYWVMTVVGCIVPYDNSWPTIVLTHIWPMVFSLGAVYYTGLFLPPFSLLPPSCQLTSMSVANGRSNNHNPPPPPPREHPLPPHLPQVDVSPLSPPLHPIHRRPCRLPARADLLLRRQYAHRLDTLFLGARAQFTMEYCFLSEYCASVLAG